MTADAHHITAPAPDGAGAQDAMRLAMQDAGITPEQVTYINAHGTSTPHGDAAETAAVKAVFGDHARTLIFASTKSMSGHLLGASGAFEVGGLRARDQERDHSAHDQPVYARSRLRPRLGAKPRRHPRRGRRALELLRVRRAQRDARGPAGGLNGRRSGGQAGRRSRDPVARSRSPIRSTRRAARRARDALALFASPIS